jgi:hypothetical protein
VNLFPLSGQANGLLQLHPGTLKICFCPPDEHLQFFFVEFENFATHLNFLSFLEMDPA